MEITIQSAQLNAQGMRVGEDLLIQELRIVGGTLSLDTEDGGRFRMLDATISVTVTETALNRLISASPVDRIRDLDLKTYSGRISISGRHALLGPVSVPFTFSAVPEIEGGKSLRLTPREMHVAGGVAVPAWLVQNIGARINERLAAELTVDNVPIPLRLTGVISEPGRIVLTAALEPSGSSMAQLPSLGSA